MKNLIPFHFRTKITLFSLFLLGSSILFYQCGKDNFNKTPIKGPNGAAAARTSYSGVYLGDNMLVFENYQLFLEIYEDLQTLSENADDPYPETDDSIEEEPFYDDDVVLEEFENNLGFYSLRKQYLLWEHEHLLSGREPQDVPEPFTEDDVLLACLNTNSMVQIGQFFYWFKSEYEVYVIPVDGYAGMLDEIMNSENPLTYPGITIVETARGTTGDCDATFYYSGFGNTLTGTFIYNGIPVPPAPGVKFKWVFGDGATSTDQNPSHTYATAGSYNVCLTITAGDTCSATKCIVVKAGASCSAYFRYDRTGEDCVLSFADLSSTAGGNITSWEWEFPGGDPATYNGQDPGAVKFNCNGKKSVKLKIKNNQGCTDTYIEQVDVTTCSCCRMKQKEKNFKEYDNGEKRIKWTQKQTQTFLSRSVMAKMKNYKRKSNGKWKKSKGDLGIELSEFVYTQNAAGCSCEQPFPVEGQATNKKRKLKLRKRIGEDYDGKYDFPWYADFKIGGASILKRPMPTLCD